MMKHLDHPKRRGQRRPENLREQVDAKTMALFPTPTAQQYGTGQNGKRSDGTTYKQAGKPSLQTMALHNLWPTPTAMNGGEKVAPSHKDGSHGWNTGAAVQDSLSDNPTKLWPTPTVHGNNNRKGISKKAGDGLATAVKMWPTPRASEYKDCGPVGSKSHTHMRDRSYLCAKAKDPDQPTGKLNPAWVEWLMGFPTGWTELED
tara:strand:- start:54 stop:662 length:609 start_codon:yes stop_codon:yes gene_type:complete